MPNHICPSLSSRILNGKALAIRRYFLNNPFCRSTANTVPSLVPAQIVPCLSTLRPSIKSYPVRPCGFPKTSIVPASGLIMLMPSLPPTRMLPWGSSKTLKILFEMSPWFFVNLLLLLVFGSRMVTPPTVENQILPFLSVMIVMVKFCARPSFSLNFFTVLLASLTTTVPELFLTIHI